LASQRTAFLLTLTLALTLGLAAAPARGDDYPTWEDVEAAKSNETAKRAQIAQIEALLAGLENEVAAFAIAALEAGELYNQALDALESATATAGALEERSDAAASRAEKSSQQAGALIAQLARTGGTDFTVELMLSPANDADDMLYRIGAMSKLSEQSAQLYEQAVLDRNQALAMSSQAASARAARQELADEAAAALAAAELASSSTRSSRR
jgi:endo-alpha-1,4-polygalactosaminidase (GH114 family)